MKLQTAMVFVKPVAVAVLVVAAGLGSFRVYRAIWKARVLRSTKLIYPPHRMHK